jgi:AcrR family transcriptional regulator
MVRIVAARGLDAVTLRSVADEARVSYGLPSYHFGTREEMIKEVLTWAANQALRDTKLQTQAGESLDDFASQLPSLIAERPEYSIFQFELALNGLRRPELLDLVRSVYNNYVATVQASLRRLGLSDDLAFARLVMGAIIGLNLQALLYGEDAGMDQAYEELRSLLRSQAVK